MGSVGKWTVKLVNESALIGLHFAPFFCVLLAASIAWCVEGVFCPPGLCTASVATYREIPLEGVIAAFAGFTGGRWIDRIPPRCHRAKMRGICGSLCVSYGVGFSGRLGRGKRLVNGW